MEEKSESVLLGKTGCQSLKLGDFESRVRARLSLWEKDRFAARLWQKDPTLWFSEPVPEITDRLGWLTAPDTMRGQIDQFNGFAREISARGTAHVVLLGMGGSSLAPEVFQQIFGNSQAHPSLIVLDSTHPGAVRLVESQVDLRRTFFLVSSKSGTTTETISLFRYFWQRISHGSDRPGSQFAAITDPGTPLEKLARERRFGHVFHAPADIGGRYSALTVFGLVPAALIGVDVNMLLDRAGRMVEGAVASVPESENPCLVLAAALGELAHAGLDKATFVVSPSLAAFPLWIEQLIAESTGKQGRGIIPVVDEGVGSLDVYRRDRFFVYLSVDGDEDAEMINRISLLETAGYPTICIRLADKADLGQEFFRWEMAVAAAGTVLGIHPFDQPDVEVAKELAREAMANRTGTGRAFAAGEAKPIMASDTGLLEREITGSLNGVHARDYVAIHAYLTPTAQTTAGLQTIRTTLRDRLRVATTFGYGPRFLHSTGQLHKGGPNTGVFLQLIDEPETDLPVPETDYTFGTLIRAQAFGDIQALAQRKRRVLRLNLGKDVPAGLAQLARVLRHCKQF
ncbi:MAG: hypothetical protein HY695_19510 [Deltaproteobacteria bacterium]|nr:hypothetical protein [Deltaproteobacteria bacterium]